MFLNTNIYMKSFNIGRLGFMAPVEVVAAGRLLVLALAWVMRHRGPSLVASAVEQGRLEHRWLRTAWLAALVAAGILLPLGAHSSLEKLAGS